MRSGCYLARTRSGRRWINQVFTTSQPESRETAPDAARLRLGVVLHNERQAFYQTFKAGIDGL